MQPATVTRGDMASILVVDDDRDIRETLAEVLEVAGHTVRKASHGGEALESLRADPAEVVLLDLMMPGMDGWTFVREQQADAELADIPVVVVTAAPVDAPIPGVRAYLPKPFDLDRLLAVVAQVASS